MSTTTMERPRTLEKARGRWREILPQLGVPPKFLNGLHQPCVLCGGIDRARYTDLKGDGDYFCNQCGSGSGMHLLMKLHKWDFARAAHEVDKIIGNLPPSTKVVALPVRRVTTEVEMKRIWNSAALITPESSPGKYLTGRGIDEFFAKYDSALRSSIATFHPYAQVFPVMLAKFCDTTGVGRQIHQTFLTDYGGRAEVKPNKKFLKGVLPKGGAIRLGEPAEVMGVAEGIETALSAAKLFNMPVWATTSALMLVLFEPPVGVKRLVIFGDNDASYTGQHSAYALANRLVCTNREKGIERKVEVCIPSIVGQDWNDVLIAEAGHAAH